MSRLKKIARDLKKSGVPPEKVPDLVNQIRQNGFSPLFLMSNEKENIKISYDISETEKQIEKSIKANSQLKIIESLFLSKLETVESPFLSSEFDEERTIRQKIQEEIEEVVEEVGKPEAVNNTEKKQTSQKQKEYYGRRQNTKKV